VSGKLLLIAGLSLMVGFTAFVWTAYATADWRWLTGALACFLLLAGKS